jgi:hypothetical protein
MDQATLVVAWHEFPFCNIFPLGDDETRNHHGQITAFEKNAPKID